MPKRQYHIVDGRVIGETSGGVRTDYLRDALGSVTGTVNQSAQVRNTYRWKPHGSELASTGPDPDPGVGWNGTWGYRPTGRLRASHYVVHRHYDQLSGQWTTVDPLWPDEPAFAYGWGTPTSVQDAMGLRPCCPSAIATCTAQCTLNGCLVWQCEEAPHKGGWHIVTCDCIDECPNPIRSQAQALRGGLLDLNRRYGPCGKRKPNAATDFLCDCDPKLPPEPSGKHYTWTIRCSGRSYALSVMCCKCQNSLGKQSEHCWYKIHPSR
ncbi:MAG: hypothetical protein HONBIEJF_02600 [Fimbriimonadaceae bacterium]|nr:hypothetical protein [Fimbriimonadaceae bacterium]